MLLRQEVRRAAGEVMVCGFAGTQVDAELREVLRELQPIGLILFARNIASTEALVELTAELKALRPASPLLLAVDQEGGRVARVRQGVSVWPPMAALGQHNDEKLAHQVGAALGREVRALGFDVNFAPVLDVDTNANNPVIGDRALSKDAADAGRLGAAMVRGLQGAGVAACGKHFPGHGDTDVDSHLALPTLEHDLDRLRGVEWPPFRAAIAAGVASIMTAHVKVPALDEHLPATLSRRALTEVLRGELGFRGVIVGDDVDMRGLADHHDADSVGPLGLNAGVDLFLACKDPAAMFALYRGIVRATEDGRVNHDVLEAAAARTRALAQRFGRPAMAPRRAIAELREACDAHRGLVDRIKAEPQMP